MDEQEGAGSVQTFVQATIEYDPYHNFDKSPLQDFIKKFSSSYGTALKLVETTRWWHPRMTLKGKNGEKEHISLANWRADMMKEFLDGKLEKSSE